MITASGVSKKQRYTLALPPDLPDFHPHSSWDPRRSGAS